MECWCTKQEQVNLSHAFLRTGRSGVKCDNCSKQLPRTWQISQTTVWLIVLQHHDPHHTRFIETRILRVAMHRVEHPPELPALFLLLVAV